MQTYHFDEVVNDEGVVTLSGLPPHAEITVMIIQTEELLDWQIQLNELRKELQKTHPFAKMSREEILAKLHQTREKVYDETYGYRHAN